MKSPPTLLSKGLRAPFRRKPGMRRRFEFVRYSSVRFLTDIVGCIGCMSDPENNVPTRIGEYKKCSDPKKPRHRYARQPGVPGDDAIHNRDAENLDVVRERVEFREKIAMGTRV